MLAACFVVPRFGIACERARRPDLHDCPIALHDGSTEGRLAVVAAEAERYGVEPGQPASAARALCPGLVVLPYDRPAYDEAARPLWDLFAVESSTVEPVSPEVCFVEMTGREIPARVQALAGALAPRIGQPLRVGLAASKFVARQAALTPPQPAKAAKVRPSSTQAATEEVVVVPVGREAAFLAPLPLEQVPGLDFRLRQKLERLGVRRFGDVLALPPARLQRQAREVGLLLQRLATGADGDRVKPLWPPPSIEAATTFEDEVNDEPTIHEALRRAAADIAQKLALRREFCRTLTLTAGTADGCYLQETERLALPADEAGALGRGALRLLRRIPLDKPLVELILRAGELGSGSGVQLALLDDNQSLRGLPHERRARLQAVLAWLRRRFPLSAPIPARMLRDARRIGLWTYPLGHLLDTPVEVATNREGEPLRYRGRRGRRVYEGTVRHVHTRWREADWVWDRLSERTVWRVETDPSGLSELHQLGVEWRLGAVAD